MHATIVGLGTCNKNVDTCSNLTSGSMTKPSTESIWVWDVWVSSETAKIKQCYFDAWLYSFTCNMFEKSLAMIQLQALAVFPREPLQYLNV